MTLILVIAIAMVIAMQQRHRKELYINMLLAIVLGLDDSVGRVLACCSRALFCILSDCLQIGVS